MDVCQIITKTTEKALNANKQEAYHYWIKKLQKRLKKVLSIEKNELLTLSGKNNVQDLSSFTKHLQTELETSCEKLCKIYEGHDETHLSSTSEDSVYSLIAKECKGCTAKCPFCDAPCSRSLDNHTTILKEKHAALEHYPLACSGKTRHGHLIMENCSILVSSEEEFFNADTNNPPCRFKDYKQLYPDWQFDEDPNIEISQCWRRFVVKYGHLLAEKYDAEIPNVPEA